MKITVFCKPSAKLSKIEQVDESSYRVSVKAMPEDGEANFEVRKVLADYFKVPVANVLILAGQKSRRKIVGIK